MHTAEVNLAGYDSFSDMGALYTVQIMVVIYVSSEGEKFYIKDLYVLVDMLFLYMSLSSSQLERQGRKAG